MVDIPAGIRSSVASAPPDELFTFVIEWDESLALDAAETRGTRQEKYAALKAVLSDLKAPLLDELRLVPTVSVNDIEGSGHAVAMASAATWQSLFDSSSLQQSNVTLNPNARYFAH